MTSAEMDELVRRANASGFDSVAEYAVSLEAIVDDARSVMLDVARTRRSDAWGVVVNRANEWLREAA